MNRIQFFILTGLSSLVVLLLIGHILLTRQASFQTNTFNQDRQIISQGQASQTIVKQLAQIIFQNSQKLQDTELKDLLSRQQITIAPPAAAATNTDESAAPSTAPSTH